LKYFTDPTYLRTIYDGLNSGAIHKDNASALPMGLVGLYEDALPPSSNVNERKKFFEFFAVWSLLKKEVSAEFVVPLLEGWTEEQVTGYIAQFSKWFNSPASGKYVLYHERLRTYVLQKISQNHFVNCNEDIIWQCQRALQEKNGNEWERYALEYLSMHILITAIENGDNSALKSLAYDTTHWNRQVEISKGFEWSKRMLNDMMLWAAKYDDEEVIECALNKVDLHHLEQNDAPRIVELLAQNDIETALQRIESFGGSDKEGLQRKFILYMLCLMELTLLDSKNKPFRKDAIEKLLKHLDDNIPVDHSVLNWNDFFPSYLVFLISVEIKKIDLDYYELYKRTDNWDSDWIKNHGLYTEVQIEVMLGATKSITKSTKKIKVLRKISIVLYTQKHFELSEEVIQKAIVCVNDIIDKNDKCTSLIIISDSFISQGNKEMAWLITQQAIDISEEISDIDEKSTALVNISVGLATQGKIALALETAHEISDELAEKSDALKDISINVAEQGNIVKALEITTEINDEDLKNRALNEIAVKAVINGNFKQALEIAELINDLEIKVNVFCKISTNQFKQNNILLSEQIMQQALLLVKEIKADWQKVYALRDISVGFLKQNRLKESFQIINEALEITKLINHGSFKKMLLSFISMDLVKMGNIEMGIDVANGILGERENIDAINNICIELTTQGNIEKVFDVFKLNYNEQSLRLILKNITNILLKQGNIKRANQVTQLSINSGTINKFVKKHEIIKEIYFELINENKIEQAITIVEGLEDQFVKCELLVLGCSDLINQGNNNKAELLLNKAHLNIKNIDEDKLKCECLIAISSTYFNFENFALSNEILKQAIEVANGITDDDSRDYSIIDISKEFSKRGSFVEAISLSKEIKSELKKSLLLKNVAIEFSKHKRLEEAIEITKNINVEWIKSDVLSTIAIEISKQDLLNNVLDIIPQITEEEVKQDTLYKISVVLSKNGDLDKALEIIEKIESIKQKVYALVSISNQFFITSDVVKAEQTLNAAILLINYIDDVRTLSFINMWITKTYLKQGNEILAFEKVLKITQINNRIKFWKKLGSENYLEKSITFCITQIKTLPNEEAIFFYKSGMAEAITATNANASNVLELLELVKEDTKSIAHLLQMHALYLCFFENTNSIKMQRLNKTLNIQWALDIVAKFEKEFERASHNVQEWINEIEDENDREDVLSWSEKVAQGKMTEDKFLERINKL
jgi:tetratricopeptide (TPR) repeat protein